MIGPLSITILVVLCLVISAANLAMNIYVLVEYKPSNEPQIKEQASHTMLQSPPIRNRKFGQASYHTIQTIRDANGNIVVFDIFLRNHLLVAICPHDIDIPQIKYESKLLIPKDHFECKKWEPFHILTYDLSSPTDQYVTIDVNNQTIVLYHQQVKLTTNIVATHLNLYQIQYTPIWQSYMSKSGIDDFILYYNGNDDAMDNYASDNVLVIRWPFPYRLEHQPRNSYAQIAQLNHALYKYGCFANYIANIDVDEFPLITVSQQSLLKQNQINGILFANQWIDDRNGTIYVSHRYQNYRSKYIVAVNAVKALRIHKPWEWNHFDETSVMRHVSTWQRNRPKQVLEEIQVPTNVKWIEFLNAGVDLPLPTEEEVYDSE